MTKYSDLSDWERVELAIERVKDRLVRTTTSFEIAGIPYALCGSNATACWIETVDPAAVRQCRNIEVLLNRDDLARATSALEAAGFVAIVVDGRQRFLDGPDGSVRSSIEVVFAGESLGGKSPAARTPSVTDHMRMLQSKVLQLAPLVELQLARFRLDDAVDVRDMLDVGLLDATWLDRLPAESAARLRHLIDTPDG